MSRRDLGVALERANRALIEALHIAQREHIDGIINDLEIAQARTDSVLVWYAGARYFPMIRRAGL